MSLFGISSNKSGGFPFVGYSRQDSYCPLVLAGSCQLVETIGTIVVVSAGRVIWDRTKELIDVRLCSDIGWSPSMVSTAGRSHGKQQQKQQLIFYNLLLLLNKPLLLPRLQLASIFPCPLGTVHFKRSQAQSEATLPSMTAESPMKKSEQTKAISPSSPCLFVAYYRS